jgi:hypothetical protein
MVGRTFSYRSRSISRGPITISNASLIESDVMLVLNKESFRTLQFIRLPRDLAVIGITFLLLGYAARSAFTCGAYGSTGWTRAEKTSKSRLNTTRGLRFSGVIFRAILCYLQGNIMPIAGHLVSNIQLWFLVP